MTGYDAQAGREMPDDPGAASEEAISDDVDLQVGLSGLAGIVAGSLGIDELLAQVAVFATRAIPGADGAGVTLLRATEGTGQIATWAATPDFVLEIDRIQYELLDEGPCVTCMQTARTVVSGSLGSDARWPRFGGRVSQLGVHSTLSLPLVVADRVIGAINSYAHERDAFSEHAVRLGEQFAGPAAVSVRNAQLLTVIRTKADQMQSALKSRAIIDQAIGIVRSRSGASAEDAFGRLRQISQSEGVTLPVVAQQLVDEAVRRARARHAHSQSPTR